MAAGKLLFKFYVSIGVSTYSLCSKTTDASNTSTRVDGSASCSVVSDSVTPRTVAARLLGAWDSPDKNAGVGCHFLLQVKWGGEGQRARRVVSA